MAADRPAVRAYGWRCGGSCGHIARTGNGILRHESAAHGGMAREWELQDPFADDESR